jgi:hypothetical protein
MGTLARAGLAGFIRVFGAPLPLALVSPIGLLSALLGDGLWAALSWAALATPVAVIVWCVGWAVRRV